ncbi:Na(+)/H(+) exchange regulatory cofactor NHE-RF1 [Aphelenchoides fujianensis]|nr:Na(+)/H(+) exchange regulatory cofactor NHE-RF1 [Aphelenchoides fujianensis]
MVNQPSAVPEPPRVCVIRKTHAGQEYGFNLHSERTHQQYVGAVDANSPADRGGLRQGDRIIGVNGTIIVGETHKEVVQKIKQNPMQCEMLVISEEGLRWHEQHGVAFSYDLPNIVRGNEAVDLNSTADSPPPPPGDPTATFVSIARIELKSNQSAPSTNGNNNKRDMEHAHQRGSVSSAAFDSAAPVAAATPAAVMSPRPLLCHLRKQGPTDEFGFNLHAERNKGHFIGAVDKGGIGDLAGLETGQRIVGVNGELIYPTSPHKEVVALIKRDPLDTRLLVASEEVDRFYTDNNIPYSFDLAIVHESARQTERHSPTLITRTPLDSPTLQRRNEPAMPTNQNVADVTVDAVYVPEAPEAVEIPTAEVNALPPPTFELADEVAAVESAVESAAVGPVGTADDLLDQVFSRVQPPEVRARRDTVGSEVAIAVAQEAAAPRLLQHQEAVDHEKHVISNHNSPLHVAAHSTGSSSTSPGHDYAQQPPVTTYTPSSQFGLESPHSDKRSLNSPDSHKDENVDIFKLSAKEARQMMRRGRRDPRLQANLTLEQKHQLIANL